ncbi:GAF and ANTAR domain-containing protein [Streptomyces sp. ODS28]|uniref:GAF and ANTAR domain-containing protein n=1 Tax=Streptomyces sp. ODS28 TaxID=3136688 RepID=UPI0031EDE97C
MAREQRVLETLLEAVDSLVEEFDLFDFLHRVATRCVELLDVEAAGILLADQRGELHVIAASDEHTRLLELFALQHDQGPCVDAYRSGAASLDVDLADPEAVSGFGPFAERAREAGFRTTHALPMRLREQVIGAINLFHGGQHTLGVKDAHLGQTLADMATIAILQQRTIERGNVEKAQLQTALTSRIVIEQAKGILSERWQTSLDEAFAALRNYARAHRLRMLDLAYGLTTGELDTDRLRK